MRNTTPQPLTLNFTSSQRYDFAIRNAAGDEVYRWSAVRSFLQVIGTEEIANGERNYVEPIPLANLAGEPLPAGPYSLDAWITNTEAPRYTGTVSFDIR